MVLRDRDQDEDTATGTAGLPTGIEERLYPLYDARGEVDQLVLGALLRLSVPTSPYVWLTGEARCVGSPH